MIPSRTKYNRWPISVRASRSQIGYVKALAVLEAEQITLKSKIAMSTEAIDAMLDEYNAMKAAANAS